MPYVSQAQEKYFNANKKQLESKGVNVSEWNKASKGKKLPAKKKKVTHGLYSSEAVANASQIRSDARG